MGDHKKLTYLIQKAAKTYLKHAGPCGKLLKDLNSAFEKTILETTLKHFNHNISLSAKALGISRTSLYHKIKVHKISSNNPA